MKASNVARWFLQDNKLDNIFGDSDLISNLKLQKLLYYTQGAHLAMYDKPFFDDPIEAWQHGPVVPSVYYEYAKNGGRGIEEFDLMTEKPTEEELDTLVLVKNEFGQYSAWRLRNMTHEERPWKETKQGDVIPIDLIRDFFIEEYLEE